MNLFHPSPWRKASTMPDLVVRDFSQEELDAMKQMAYPQSMQVWSKSVLLEALKSPKVEQCYMLKGFSALPDMASVVIRRLGSDISHCASVDMTQAQQESLKLALQFVKSNGPSDRESAISALKQGFEHVFETILP